MKRGANEVSLAIEVRAAHRPALCGRGRGAPNPLVGHAIASHCHLDDWPEPVAGAGGDEAACRHAGGRFTGAAITVSLMFSTVTFPYWPWQTALVPVLAVALLAYISTRLGRAKKERLGTAEKRQGRQRPRWRPTWAWPRWSPAKLVQSSAASIPAGSRALAFAPMPLFAVGLAALAEAAADTVSSESRPGAGRPAAHDHHPARSRAGHGRSHQPGRHAGRGGCGGPSSRPLERWRCAAT